MTGAKVFGLATGPSGAPWIVSPSQGTIWTTARLATPGAPKPAQWGIHAYRNLAGAVQAQYDSDQRGSHPGADAVYAIVRPDGDVIVGEHGWVAQAATIVRIFLPPSLWSAAPALYSRYRVPVQVLPSRFRRQRRPDVSAIAAWVRCHYGPEHARRAIASTLYAVAYGEPAATTDCRLASEHAANWGYPGPAIGGAWYASSTGPGLTLYDPVFARRAQALDIMRREREAREREEARVRQQRAWEESRERQAREKVADQLRALKILRPYLPIATVRVSSAQARGNAKQYSYWGAVRYQIVATADGTAASNTPLECASSDRRSERLARRDAEEIAASEGRILCQRIGRLSAAEAGRIADELQEASHAA